MYYFTLPNHNTTPLFLRYVLSLVTGLVLLLFNGNASVGFSFSPPLTLAAGLNPAAIVAIDLTGNTLLDLVVVNSASDDAYVYTGDGAGNFTFDSSFSVGNFPQGIAADDFDGDLDNDIATTSVPFNTGNVSVWLGNGDGTFQTPVINVSDDGPRPVATADFNDDLEHDLITTNATRGNLSVFLGNGNGTFGSELRTAVGSASSFPTDLALADFNEDLDIDVITSNAQSANDSLGLLLGNGDGTFSTVTPVLTTCNRPESVVTGDFDGDQHVDVAVACFQSNDVVVLLGDGTGGFGSPVVYSLLPQAANPYWILAADMDGDAVLDLVTSNNGSFAILRGMGDVSFDAPFVIDNVGTLYGAVAEDFNGDGLTDLAFTNFGTDEVDIYLNLSTPPTTIPLMTSSALAALALLLASITAAARTKSKSPRAT